MGTTLHHEARTDERFLFVRICCNIGFYHFFNATLNYLFLMYVKYDSVLRNELNFALYRRFIHLKLCTFLPHFFIQIDKFSIISLDSQFRASM